MKRFLATALLALAFTGSSFAQSNVSTQQVSVTVEDIAIIAVQGTINMTINAATAGQAPDAATAKIGRAHV